MVWCTKDGGAYCSGCPQVGMMACGMGMYGGMYGAYGGSTGGGGGNCEPFCEDDPAWYCTEPTMEAMCSGCAYCHDDDDDDEDGGMYGGPSCDCSCYGAGAFVMDVTGMG